MTKNLAIIVGVTDYLDEKLRLPACENDVSIMRELLLGSRKFHEVIVVPSDDAQLLKARLAETVGRFQQEDIGELFFYFSGHGEFAEDEFRFMLRDYSSGRPAQTTLENSELDHLLRSLSPVLVVKVVDACYSGMPYIKDGSSLADQIMTQSQNQFSKCYFLFSSQSDQRSWVTGHISDFTKAFVETVAHSTLEVIRYKDIVDGLSDAFQSTPRQRPQFVIQGDYTESFGNFSDEVRQRLKRRLECFTAPTSTDRTEFPTVVKSSLSDIARAQAVDYVSMDKAIEAVADTKHALDTMELQQDLRSLFTTKIDYFENYDGLPAKGVLGQWLAKNDAVFFASPQYSTETYEVDSPLSGFLALSGQETKKIIRTREVISGLYSKVPNLPFQAFRIELKPLLPNLTQYGGWMTFILSKRSVQTFYCFAEYKEVAWDKYHYESVTEWQSSAFSLASFEGGTTIVMGFTAALERYVTACVAARLGVAPEGQSPVSGT